MNMGKSELRGALQRIGSQLKEVEDVIGLFTPTSTDSDGRRVYGTLETHDARVAIGFDRGRVKLPPHDQKMVLSVTGKPWVDGRTSRITLMVSKYFIVGNSQTGGNAC